jgi:peptidoglycan/LPS O-acetylase OafA/YrhL
MKEAAASQPANLPESDQIPCLDGWRAIAIGMVIVAHGFWHFSRPLQKLGALGVNLFFAISGYLICTLLLREYERTGQISLKKFYIRRVFRILPPAILYLSVVTILAFLGWIQVQKHELITALFAANYFPDRLWFTAHFWSLSVEEHFYLVWPGLLLLLKPKKACWFGLALAAICVVYRPWAAGHFPGGGNYQRTDMRIDAFVLPCALAILLRNPVWRNRAARWLTAWNIILLVVLVLIASLLAERNSALNTLNKLLQAAVLPLIVVSPILRGSSWLAQVLNWRPLQWVGQISYGIYLWQELFLYDTSSSPQRMMLLPLAIAAMLLCAMISNHFLERPLRNYGRRLAAGKKLPELANLVNSKFSI